MGISGLSVLCLCLCVCVVRLLGISHASRFVNNMVPSRAKNPCRDDSKVNWNKGLISAAPHPFHYKTLSRPPSTRECVDGTANGVCTANWVYNTRVVLAPKHPKLRIHKHTAMPLQTCWSIARKCVVPPSGRDTVRCAYPQ